MTHILDCDHIIDVIVYAFLQFDGCDFLALVLFDIFVTFVPLLVALTNADWAVTVHRSGVLKVVCFCKDSDTAVLEIVLTHANLINIIFESIHWVRDWESKMCVIPLIPSFDVLILFE